MSVKPLTTEITEIRTTTKICKNYRLNTKCAAHLRVQEWASLYWVKWKKSSCPIIIEDAPSRLDPYSYHSLYCRHFSIAKDQTPSRRWGSLYNFEMKDPLHCNFTALEKNSLQSRVWSIFQLKNFPLIFQPELFIWGDATFLKKVRSYIVGNANTLRLIFWNFLLDCNQGLVWAPAWSKCPLLTVLLRLLFFPARKTSTIFFLFKKRDCGVWRKRESFVRISNWTAFVCPIFFACTAARQARISALPLSEHWSWNPCPSHEHPRPFQILHRKAVTAILRGLF